MHRYSYLIFLYLIFTACQSGKDVKPDIIQQSQSTLVSDPNATTRSIDSILYAPTTRGISSSSQIELKLIRQRAYAAIGRMDSVLSAGISIRKDAERAGDSLSIAKSLLPVRGKYP